ncbi:DegV family protein [Collinsella sp. zg1085]|uniref:DegV family protein n=1 Tax=Collinsella sp. zg1085 TaxID=2844380 RepID=UPI001C0BB7B8|nr:DegV family protein [Collinsella sp. zg1085]QWT18127.1 DegV family protein [Collinsella sp. zg1085]
MSSYVLSACSTADLPRVFFEQHHVLCIPFHYTIDGHVYPDDLYASTSPAEFFGRIKAGDEPTTSQVSVGDYLINWEPLLQAGHDILHLTLSSGISGTYESACIARDQLKAAYPERRIQVVDSLSASAGYGLVLRYLVELKQAGLTFDELSAWIEAHKLDVNAWFFVSDLECLKRGGRISKTNALIATALKICPIININVEGKLIPQSKVRTKKRAIAELAKLFVVHAENGVAYTGKCCISHSDCLEDAKELARQIENLVPALAGEIMISDIGAVIGSHTGPGTVALFFMGDTRVD